MLRRGASRSFLDSRPAKAAVVVGWGSGLEGAATAEGVDRAVDLNVQPALEGGSGNSPTTADGDGGDLTLADELLHATGGAVKTGCDLAGGDECLLRSRGA